MITWSVGDVVVLKSGGPRMTIDELLSNPRGQIAICVWFKENKRMSGRFISASLEIPTK